MVRDWHELFKSWSKPPSEKEETKGSNAARMINDALRSYESLKSRNFDVYATGSYRNNTNVRLGSDIDVAVVLTEACYIDYPSEGAPTQEILGFRDASYTLAEFRSDVKEALVAKFGAEGVDPGEKTFNVCETSKRLDADVTPFFEYRRYSGARNPDGSWHYHQGVETRSSKEPDRRINNWHQQHYDEGVKRNNATNRRFKRVTRILKRLRADMMASTYDEVVAAAKPIPSFLIECLVFNAPDHCFNREEGSYYEDVRQTIGYLWIASNSDQICKDFTEVSKMKPLFSSAQPWSRDAVRKFLSRAYIHIGS